jgi:hypothetical protein
MFLEAEFRGELAAGGGDSAAEKMESRDVGPNVQAFLFFREISVISPKNLREPLLDSPASLYVGSWEMQEGSGVVWADRAVELAG